MRVKTYRMSNQILARICLSRAPEKFRSHYEVVADRSDGEWGDALIVSPYALVFPKEVEGHIRALRLAAKLAAKINREVRRIDEGRLVWDAKAKRHVPRGRR